MIGCVFVYLQVGKLGTLLFGSHSCRGGQQVFTLQHAHIPNLHKLQTIFNGVLSAVVERYFSALHSDRRSRGNLSGQLQSTFDSLFRCFKHSTDQAKLLGL